MLEVLGGSAFTFLQAIFAAAHAMLRQQVPEDDEATAGYRGFRFRETVSGQAGEEICFGEEHPISVRQASALPTP